MRADYVIVGASSAGCALASRLTEDPLVRVLLIDAGGRDHNPWVHIPLGYARAYRDLQLYWEFDSDLGGREHIAYRPSAKARSRVSSINGMVYVQGKPEDFDLWARLGCRGWGWNDVLPYFRKAENWGRDERTDKTSADDTPLYRAIAQAGERIGLGYHSVIDGWSDAGIIYSSNIRFGRQSLRSGRRDARLPPVRPNLTIIDDALVNRVLFEGRRAIGVEYFRGDEYQRVGAEREVILSAGAIGSPRILQLSGVGAAEDLRRVGIPVHYELNGVGCNLQDPYIVQTEREMPIAALQYLFAGNDCLAAPVKVREGAAIAEFDCFFVAKPETKFSGLSAGMTQMRPLSRGYVRLASADPRQAPEVSSHFLSDETDRQAMVAGLRFLDNIFAAPTFTQFGAIGFRRDVSAKPDDELIDYARGHGSTFYQKSGTCRMGSDGMAVVDEELRVRGLGGLRIVDASVMPTASSATMETASITISEKGADLIRAAHSTATSRGATGKTGKTEPREVNVWVSEKQVEVEQPFTVSLNIGAPSQSRDASAPFVDVEFGDAEAIDLVVSLSCLTCRIEPGWQKLKLPREGDSQVIKFNVVATVKGDCELSIRVYLAKRLIPLQSLSFSVTVEPAQAEATA